MASAGLRPVVAAVLAVGLGFAVARSDVPVRRQSAIAAVAHAGGVAIVDWSGFGDAPDFIAPPGVALPVPPTVARAPSWWGRAPASGFLGDVLVLAPKTSPPV